MFRYSDCGNFFIQFYCTLLSRLERVWNLDKDGWYLAKVLTNFVSTKQMTHLINSDKWLVAPTWYSAAYDLTIGAASACANNLDQAFFRMIQVQYRHLHSLYDTSAI